MAQTRASDEFATIRARLEELRRDREQAADVEKAMASGRVSVRADRIVHVVIPVRRLNKSTG
jgi:DNA-binding transcriptional regulator/RsmH inhibitor MraZ